MNFVIFNAIDADRLKSAEANVKGDLNSFDAAGADAIENRLGEVETGGGRGDGAARLGVDGLITLAIGGGIGASDVGRKRDVADAIEDVVEVGDRVGGVPDWMKTDVAFTEGSAGDDFGLQLVLFAEEQVLADIDFAAGTNQALPIVGLGGKLAGKQDLDASVKIAAGGGVAAADGLRAETSAAPVEAGGKDAGVIENDNIVGAEEIGQIAKMAVMELAGIAMQVQHAGTVASGGRFLGDELFGKMEVEIGNQHGLRLQEVQRARAQQGQEFQRRA